VVILITSSYSFFKEAAVYSEIKFLKNKYSGNLIGLKFSKDTVFVVKDGKRYLSIVNENKNIKLANENVMGDTLFVQDLDIMFDVVYFLKIKDDSILFKQSKKSKVIYKISIYNLEGYVSYNQVKRFKVLKVVLGTIILLVAGITTYYSL
jgi:hypothetical protein